MQNNKGKGRLKYLLQQTEIFAHFAKGDQSSSQKAKGKYDFCSFEIFQLTCTLVHSYNMNGSGLPAVIIYIVHI